MAEIDVRLSKDLVPVLLHDDTINRTTNGRGPVSSYTAAQLARFDAGSWFGAAFAGERLPTLQAVIETVGEKMCLNIELKLVLNKKNLVRRVLDVLTNYNCFHRCLISSFDTDMIASVRRLNPDVTTALICTALPEGWTWDSHLCLRHKAVSRQLVETARRHNKFVYVWTVNHKSRMQKLISMGVDGIMTNFPARLSEVFYEREEKL